MTTDVILIPRSLPVEIRTLTREIVTSELAKNTEIWEDHGIKIDLVKLQELWQHVDCLKSQKPKGSLLNPYSDLASLINEKTICLGTNRLFLWTGNHFEVDCEPYFYRVLNQLCNIIGLKYSKKFSEEVIDILLKQFFVEDVLEFNNHVELIPFQNLYLNWKTGETVLPHPKYKLTYVFPFEYDPSATCPRFQQFIKDILDPPYRDKVLIYLGYCCTTSLSLQKAQIWFGTGSNGKSTLFEIFSALFGKLVSNLPLHSFDRPFQLVALRNKLLNYYADLSDKRLPDEGIIKSVITDNRIECDEKNKPMASWRNTTKQIHGCNRIPLPPHNPTKGFFRRWELILFPYSFFNQNDKEYDPNNPKHKLKLNNEELKAELEKESQGIIMYVISFLPRLMELDCTNLTQLRNEWYLYSENTLQFIMDCDTSNIEAYTPCQELYVSYKNWCKIKGIKSIESMKSLAQNLSDQGISHDQMYDPDTRTRTYVYRGITVPEQYKVKVQTVIEPKQETIPLQMDNPKKSADVLYSERCKLILDFGNYHRDGMELQDIYEYVSSKMDSSKEEIETIMKRYIQNNTFALVNGKYRKG